MRDNALQVPPLPCCCSQAQEYQMPDLSPESFAALVERMALEGSGEGRSYRAHYLKGYAGPSNSAPCKCNSVPCKCNSAPCEGSCKASNLLLLNGTY